MDGKFRPIGSSTGNQPGHLKKPTVRSGNFLTGELTLTGGNR